VQLVFREIIRKALCSDAFVAIYPHELPQDLRIRVSEPDRSEFGFVSTELCFQLAKNLRIEPQRLAETILSAIDDPRFRFTIGGGGFINGFPTEEGYESFLKFSEQELNFELPELVIDWGSKYFKRGIFDEAEILRGHFGGKTLSPEDQLQLLACYGDIEISSRPYLEGYGSSENIPWLLDRFQNVSEMPIGSEAGQVEARAERLLEHPYFESTCHLRGRILQEFEERRGERALFRVIENLRLFFDLYNRPDLRVTLVTLNTLEGKFRAGLRVTKKCIEVVRDRLKFPCGL